MKPARTFSQLVLVAVAIAVTGLSASAQEVKVAAKDVPAAVIEAFKSSYPCGNQ